MFDYNKIASIKKKFPNLISQFCIIHTPLPDVGYVHTSMISEYSRTNTGNQLSLAASNNPHKRPQSSIKPKRNQLKKFAFNLQIR